MKRYVVAASIILFIALLSYTASVENALGPLFDGIRALSTMFLRSTINPFNPYFTAMSPEGVTAIVWDYRGLDTLFETTVFYMAIIGSVALYRGIEGFMKFTPGKSGGLSRIVKTVTKILIPINISVAASISLHGHLTPGGGFQAGAAMAVIPIILIVIFSRRFLIEAGISKNKALALRSLGLIGIALVVLIPVLAFITSGMPTYVMQNQLKFDAPFYYPAWFGDVLVSGSLIYYNIFEFLAVTFGFTIVFLLISIDEDTVREALRGEKIAH